MKWSHQLGNGKHIIENIYKNRGFNMIGINIETLIFVENLLISKK